MKKNAQWVIIGLLLLLTVGTIYFGLKEASSKSMTKDSTKETVIQEYPEIGYLAPSFTLKDFVGQEHELKDYRGKPVILNFWASWCQPCIQEAPYFVDIHSKYQEDVHVLSVNLLSADTLEGAKAFVEHFGYEFPTLLDQESDAATAYRIKPIPTTFFINSDGIITDGVYGGLTHADLEARTKELINPSLQ